MLWYNRKVVVPDTGGHWADNCNNRSFVERCIKIGKHSLEIAPLTKLVSHLNFKIAAIFEDDRHWL